MKKLIIVLIAVVLLLPAAASALDGDSPYFGKWAGEEHHAIKHYSTILHYINITRYKTCEYFVFNIMERGGGFSSASAEYTVYSDHWQIADDHLRIPTSAISYIDVYYDPETDTLSTKNPAVTYVRLP